LNCGPLLRRRGEPNNWLFGFGVGLLFDGDVARGLTLIAVGSLLVVYYSTTMRFGGSGDGTMSPAPWRHLTTMRKKPNKRGHRPGRRCKDDGGIGMTTTARSTSSRRVILRAAMTETDKLIEALAQIGRFCDFRPAASTPEQIEHSLAAIDCTAAMALREINAVALPS